MVRLLLIKAIFLVAILECSPQETNDLESLNIEEITLSGISIVADLEESLRQGYYSYIEKKVVLQMLGPPTRVVGREDELMETKIVRCYYGTSFFEFCDSSYGEGLSEDDYPLLSLQINSPSITIGYRDLRFQVGENAGFLHAVMDDDQIARISLQRKAFDELSEYVLRVESGEGVIKAISMTVD